MNNEKEGPVLICLHGHFGTASNFSFIKDIFDGRVIILDLRGHGFNQHANSYTMADYVGDLENLVKEKVGLPHMRVWKKWRDKIKPRLYYPEASHGIHDDEREKFVADFKSFVEKNS